MASRTTHVAELACGCWQRCSDALVDLELWDAANPEFSSGIGFGLGMVPAVICPEHGLSSVVRRTFWEWHVYCLSCGYSSWHGIDAEKARGDYERHRKLKLSHDVRVGWDGFTGKPSDQNSSGTLLVSPEEETRQLRSEAARLAAVKRHARKTSQRVRPAPARSHAPSIRESGAKDGRISLAELLESARIARERSAQPGTERGETPCPNLSLRKPS